MVFKLAADFVAGRSVTARCAANEFAFFVAEVNGDSVHFGFNGPFERFIRTELSERGGDEIADLLLRIGVVEKLSIGARCCTGLKALSGSPPTR